MQRKTEPELMLGAEQAAAYAAADFEEPHRQCVERFAAAFPDRPARARLLDLGCGPGDVTFRLARANPSYEIDAVDGSPAMLRHAQAALERMPDLAARIRFIQGLLPEARLPGRAYDIIFSNSLLHHLHDPRTLWQTVNRHARPGTLVFIHDLCRPADPAIARRLVETYAGAEPEVLKHDFYHSLLAAFTAEEVRDELDRTGWRHFRVEIVSDRHLAIHGELP